LRLVQTPQHRFGSWYRYFRIIIVVVEDIAVGVDEAQAERQVIDRLGALLADTNVGLLLCLLQDKLVFVGDELLRLLILSEIPVRGAGHVTLRGQLARGFRDAA